MFPSHDRWEDAADQIKALYDLPAKKRKELWMRLRIALCL